MSKDRDTPLVWKDGETLEQARERKKKEDLELQELMAKKAAEKAAKAKEKADELLRTQVQLIASKENVDKVLTSKNKEMENVMVDDLEPTSADTVKYEKIQKEKEFRKNVNEAIGIAANLQGDIKELKEAICEGPDCLREQVKSKFGELDQKIKRIEEQNQVFVCENCGYPKVPGLASFCPQCGAVIPSWSDEEGQPIPGWKNWQERKD